LLFLLLILAATATIALLAVAVAVAVAVLAVAIIAGLIVRSNRGESFRCFKLRIADPNLV
jgi:hypothetical protein